MANETGQSPVKTANPPANDSIDDAKEAREKAAEYRRQEQQLEQRAQEERHLLREQQRASWEVEQRLEASKGSLASFERQVQSIEGALPKEQARIAKLQQEIKDHPERAADLQGDLEGLQESVTDLQMLLTERREALDGARAEVESLTGEHQQSVELLRESWARWGATLKEAEEAEDAARQLEGAEQKFEDIEALREDGDRFNAAAAAVREDVGAAADAVVATERERLHLQAEAEDAKLDLEQAERRLEAVMKGRERSVLEKRIEENERKAQELEGKGDVRGAEELREQIVEDTRAVDFLAVHEKELRQQVDDATQKLNDVEPKLASAQAEAKEARGSYDRLEEFADQLEDKSRYLREEAAFREEAVQSRMMADRLRAEAETKTGAEREALLNDAAGVEHTAKVMDAAAAESMKKFSEVKLDDALDPKYLKILEPGLEDSAAGATTGLLTDPTAMDESTIAMASSPQDGAAGAEESPAVPAVMGDGDGVPASPEEAPFPAVVGAAEFGAEASGDPYTSEEGSVPGEVDTDGQLAASEMDAYEPVAATADTSGARSV
jgi:chromosome segregation ATPase